MTRAGDQDWLLKFLNEFAGMSEEERDAAIDALPAEGRDALVALAEARAETADADLIGALDAGHAGLDRLYEVTNPDDLFAVISLAVRDRPSIVVEALFAAVVLHRSWDEGEPAADQRAARTLALARARADHAPSRSASAARLPRSRARAGSARAAEREPPAVAEQPREGA